MERHDRRQPMTEEELRKLAEYLGPYISNSVADNVVKQFFLSVGKGAFKTFIALIAILCTAVVVYVKAKTGVDLK